MILQINTKFKLVRRTVVKFIPPIKGARFQFSCRRVLLGVGLNFSSYVTLFSDAEKCISPFSIS